MASLRRQSSPLVSPHLASLSPRDPSGLSLPPAASSSLTLPASLHRNRSFARLAKVFGLSSSAVVNDDARSPTAAVDHPAGSARASSASRPDRKNDGSDEDEEDDEDDEDADRNDEENILWEAQAALIAHHPVLAIQHYQHAALPPHRSSAACLALGNLLTRGSGLHPSEAFDVSNSSDPRKGKQRAFSTSSSVVIIPRRGSADTTGSGTRSTGNADQVGSPAGSSSTRRPGNPISRAINYFFASPPQSPLETPISSPPEKRNIDLVASGWAIPKEGKRAVRDVEGMGVAGGWFVLGLGWAVEKELAREAAVSTAAAARRSRFSSNARQDDFDLRQDGSYRRQHDSSVLEEEEDGELSNSVTFSSRRAGKVSATVSDISVKSIASSTFRQAPSTTDAPLENKASHDAAVPTSSASDASGSGRTEESSMLKTPGDRARDTVEDNGSNGDGPSRSRDEVAQTLKLMYDLLQPLLRLYRHGHIQSSDRVALPPIASSQLPPILRPQGDKAKGKNVWHLGGVVARRLLQLSLVEVEQPDRETEQRRGSVYVMANYVLGMTSSEIGHEAYFRNIIIYGTTGLEFPDELVRQASKRLDIFAKSPDTPSVAKFGQSPNAPADSAFPFPLQQLETVPEVEIVESDTEGSQHALVSKASFQSIRSGVSGLSAAPKRKRQSNMSVSSFASIFTLPNVILRPVKSTVSMASVTTTADAVVSGVTADTASSDERQTIESALSSLRRVHARSEAADFYEDHVSIYDEYDAEESDEDEADIGQDDSSDQHIHCPVPAQVEVRRNESQPKYPDLNDWVLKRSPTPSPPAVTSGSAQDLSVGPGSLEEGQPIDTKALKNAQVPTLCTIAASPQPTMFPVSEPSARRNSDRCPPATGSRLSPRRKPAIVSASTAEINTTIDPALAAAELASALTKHVVCGVCAAEGVNFPECRKCGMCFCSRECRVGDGKAGDGKRHICGVWESRFLQVPSAASPRRPSRSVAPLAANPVKAH